MKTAYIIGGVAVAATVAAFAFGKKKQTIPVTVQPAPPTANSPRPNATQFTPRTGPVPGLPNTNLQQSPNTNASNYLGCSSCNPYSIL